MMSLPGNRAQLLLAAAILIDVMAAGIAAVTLPFFVTWHWPEHVSTTIFGVALGTFIGQLGSLGIGRLTEYIRPGTLLILFTTVNFATSIVWIVAKDALVFSIDVALLCASLRVSTVIRAVLPPMIMDNQELIPFKSKVRVASLGVGGVIGVALPMTFGLCGAQSYVLVPILLAGLCLVGIWNSMSINSVLNEVQNSVDSQERNIVTEGVEGRNISLPYASVLALCMASFAGVSAVGSLTVFLLAKNGPRGAIVLGVGTLVGIISVFVVKKQHPKIKERVGKVGMTHRPVWETEYALVLAWIAVSVPLLVLFYTVEVAGWSRITCAILVLVFNEVFATIASFSTWDAQYSIGDKKDRSRTISHFSFASGFGRSAGSALAGSLYK